MRELLSEIAHDSSDAFSISDRGHVVGLYDLPNGDTSPYLFYEDGEFIDLGNELNMSYGWAVSVNSKGEVVGNYDINPDLTHGFLYSREKGFLDIGSLEDKNWDSCAAAINNASQLVGWSEIKVAGTEVLGQHAIRFERESGLIDINP
jgi:probable HAF family extracellular repeat protein